MLPLAILGAAAIGGAASYIGQQNANSANRDIASAQMAFQANQAQISNDTAWDMYHGTMAFNKEQARNAMDYNWAAQGRAMDYNSEMARRQEEFQRETLSTAMDYNTMMSNTAYQRGVADMRAAGINPMLAYSRGGATSPSIGGASGSMATAPGASGVAATGPAGHARPAMHGASARMENAMSGVVSNAVQAARSLTEVEQQIANVKQTDAATALLLEQQNQVRANTAVEVERAGHVRVQRGLVKAQHRSEEGRPALMGAQAAQLGSSAAHLDRDAAAQAERAEQIRSEAARNWNQGNLARTQEHLQRNYGQGHIGRELGSISQVVDSIRQSLRQLWQ